MDSAAFQDDAAVHGQSWPEVWEDSKKLLHQIVRAGFLVNLHKCIIFVCVGKGARFGCWLAHMCVLADKSLKKWLQVVLPRTIRELQSILGMLLWASQFIPSYKEVVQPIEALLA